MLLGCSKKLSTSLRGITSKPNGDYYCFNCFHSFRTKTKLESYRKVCENENFFNIIMPYGDAKMLV